LRHCDQAITEVDVYTIDGSMTQSDPTATQTFTSMGASAYAVQYWTGSAWATVPGGTVSGNNLVWKKLNFAATTTTKIRVVVNAASDSVARIAEVEAWTAGSGGSTANINWLVTDQLGTPRLVFDQTGSLAATKRHDYLPFGEELSSGQNGRTTTLGYGPDGIRQKFTDKERDVETGLDYFGARYYSSTQGRFNSPDDLLNDTHVSDPATWNLYVYTRNNPLRYVDPSGEKVHSGNLTADEQNELIADWKNKTGYRNVYFDQKTNNLVIDTSAGFNGGSAAARTQLSDAVATNNVFDLVHSNGDPNLLFANSREHLSPRTRKGKGLRLLKLRSTSMISKIFPAINQQSLPSRLDLLHYMR
jgi:RHS repeat-associated protein